VDRKTGRLYSIVPLVNANAAPPPVAPYVVAVRTLCEFTAKRGDLDLRFTPSPSALQGIAGHTEVTSRRGAHYQREVALNTGYRHLHVRGRADGYDPQLNRLEEIKTHRGALDKQPDNHRQLHWAQAKVYAWLLCQQLGLPAIDVALVYFDIGSQTETVLSEHHTAADLQVFFETLCDDFLHWAEQETTHRAARDAALTTLTFAHPDFRAGQRALAETVYKANLAGRCLLAQAPTGIGKTIGTLFPALKSMPGQRLDKVFFLTAKTPGRQLALDVAERLHQHAPTLPLRVLELVARDKACEHPDKACHGESCPLARGFYDRIAQARQAATQAGSLTKERLRQIAQAHSVCPYYLGQEMVRWSDVVVGDYNHFFDLNAQLYGLTMSEGWRVSLLADEAHNLVDRARQMYTAELHQGALRAIRQTAPTALKQGLDRVHRQWNALVKAQQADYQAYDDLPDKLTTALQKLSADLSEFFADHPTELDSGLQRFYFDILLFLRLAELHGPHSLFDITLEARDSALCLRNVVPGPLLQGRWAAAHSATLFSATLSPASFVMDMLGLPETTAWVDVPSAFDPAQLQVRVARHISTRYQDRQNSLDQLVDLMARQYEEAPGNYLAFFSSFDYLQLAADRLATRHPNIPVWQQSRRMLEADRDAFLARFAPQGQGIGFAVLGGAFGEGIDLPGTRLIGAFIATLGLPQVNPVNEQIKSRVHACLGHGYDYTYLFPGMQKVVQAAGRVIRTTQDQGVVWLMDDRFGRAEVRALFPSWWASGAIHTGRS
jgi:DNA excision repair protein ERCC-2